MILVIDGISYSFTPIKAFRMAHNLPESFSVASFAPKDYAGLGRIDRAGSELNMVRAAVLKAIPERIPFANLLMVVDDLTRLFEAQLMSINAQVGLREAEIGFAVAGFSDVCQAWVYALIRAKSTQVVPDFQTVYSEWLNSTVRLFADVQMYESWRVQVVAHAYGRIGLLVYRPDATDAVYDPTLACPAEGFMTGFLSDVAEKLKLKSALV